MKAVNFYTIEIICDHRGEKARIKQNSQNSTQKNMNFARNPQPWMTNDSGPLLHNLQQVPLHQLRMPVEKPDANLHPPQDQQVRMQETPVPALQPAPARPLTPHVPLPKLQDSGSHLSQMSAPLFREDRCSTSSEDETTACDAEVTFINDRRTPS